MDSICSVKTGFTSFNNFISMYSIQPIVSNLQYNKINQFNLPVPTGKIILIREIKKYGIYSVLISKKENR